jgi:23S rRNA pseudouridine2605 synthase
MPLLRLQKFISQCGIASRRKAEELIVEGQVRVNGKTITELGTKVDPGKDTVYVKNKPINKVAKGIVLFCKPREVVSTLRDPEGRPCIRDYLTKHYDSYFPVGRLDWDTSGLLIVTNDGDLAERLMHPRYGWERVYHAKVEGKVSESTLEKIERGVTLADGKVSAKAKIIEKLDNSVWLEIIVTEGRNRLVRRMMEKLRHSVIKLHRVSYGPFHIGKLKPGQIMKLSQKQYDLYRKKVFDKKNS